MQSLYPYTPRKMPFEDLESTFVGREQLIADLISNIREQADKKTLQHWMIIGTRGMGKSHIIAMIYHMVKQEKNLKASWTPVLMNEEEQGIFSLHTLFIRIVTKLGEELITEDRQRSDHVMAFINSMRNGNHSQRDIIDSAVSYLKDYVRLSGTKLLVFMENADDIFERYIRKNNEIKQLRNILQQDNFMMLVATSPTFFGGISKNSAPLYDFFRIRRLDLLSFDQAVELLKRWAVLDERINKRETASFFDKDDYRLKVLFHLTGGNPRILLFLYMAVTGEEGISNAVDTFSTLLEEDLSNYYLNRMRDLSNQLQPIILALAESEYNLTQKEIARKSFLPMQSIGTAIGRLENDGLVKAVTEKKGKNTFYALTDQLFRLWHQWRTSIHDRHIIGAIVEFLAIWYSRRELATMAECEDLTGVHCREALEFRATERFKGYWQGVFTERGGLIQQYQKQKDLNAVKGIEEKDGLDKTKTFFREKIKENPDEIESYLELAATLIRKEDYSEAEEVLQNTIALPLSEPKKSKSVIKVWANLGFARGKQDNCAGAEEAFSRAVELNPKDADYWNNLGVARFKQKNYTGAEKAFSRAVSLDPKHAGHWRNLGVTRFKQDNCASAEEAFSMAVDLDPKHAGYLNNLGAARFKQDNHAGAEEAYSRSIVLNPKDFSPYSNFSELFIIKKNTGDLVRNLKKMKTVKGIGKDIQAYLHFLMSVAFLFQKDQTPFLKNLKAAVNLTEALEAQNKHLVLGELSNFLIEITHRDRLETIKEFIEQLNNISQDIASIFNPLNYIIQYFEILFSDEKNVKTAEAKAQRLIDSITSEIKEPVKDMIECVKKNIA